MHRHRLSVGPEDIKEDKTNKNQFRALKASRSIEYTEESPLKLPPIRNNFREAGDKENKLIERDGSPYTSAVKGGKFMGKLSNRYRADRIFPSYGCGIKKNVFKTTSLRLQAKFSESDPITTSSRQYFKKNDFIKKYTEEMLKAKNMMNNKH
mmetsp:Transcript_18408/g.16276  ORF Transcript_18408/g.16276 Transcript_18408/m.16276 type:complete len:152 (-) Transcript_18408:67-522(-)